MPGTAACCCQSDSWSPAAGQQWAMLAAEAFERLSPTWSPRIIRLPVMRCWRRGARTRAPAEHLRRDVEHARQVARLGVDALGRGGALLVEFLGRGGGGAMRARHCASAPESLSLRSCGAGGGGLIVVVPVCVRRAPGR